MPLDLNELGPISCKAAGPGAPAACPCLPFSIDLGLPLALYYMRKMGRRGDGAVLQSAEQAILTWQEESHEEDKAA